MYKFVIIFNIIIIKITITKTNLIRKFTVFDQYFILIISHSMDSDIYAQYSVSANSVQINKMAHEEKM